LKTLASGVGRSGAWVFGFSWMVRAECVGRHLPAMCRRRYDRLSVSLLPSTSWHIQRRLHAAHPGCVLAVCWRRRRATGQPRRGRRPQARQCPAQSWTASEEVSWPAWWCVPRTYVHGGWRTRSRLSG